MSLESNKTLGGIGAILLAIPFLSLIGIILVLIAMKGMGEYYDDDDIFKNALYGFIFGFVGVVALVAVILMFVFGFAADPQVITPSTRFAFTGLGLFIIAFMILYAFSLIGAIFYKKSLDNLSEKSSEQMFSNENDDDDDDDDNMNSNDNEYDDIYEFRDYESPISPDANENQTFPDSTVADNLI